MTLYCISFDDVKIYCSHSIEDLTSLVKQNLMIFSLSQFSIDENNKFNDAVYQALRKLYECLFYAKNKYTKENEKVIFSVLHSSHYCIFLYFLSNILFKMQLIELSTKVYLFNKMMNCVDLYYEVELPDIFILDHPLGSVFGRASYKNFFCFSQGCTVGNSKGCYPIINEHVTMFSHSSILGNSHIGDHVILSSHAYVLDECIPPYSLVFGESPNLTIKSINREYFLSLNPFNV